MSDVWAIRSCTTYGIPPDEWGTWDGKGWVRWKGAKFYETEEDARAALVGVALLYPPQKTDSWETKLFVMKIDEALRNAFDELERSFED